MSLTLLVVAKSPRPGLVKTRLTPRLSPAQAAAVAEAMLVDTLRAVRLAEVDRRVLYLDGPVGPWLPAGFDVVAQTSGGLDVRLGAALSHCEGPVLLIGMDTPQVHAALLDDTRDALLGPGTDAVLGPATDGGFWALGLLEPDPGLVVGVPMSVPSTGALQRARLDEAGLRVQDLRVLRDVDTPADAAEVALMVPGSQFALTWHHIVAAA